MKLRLNGGIMEKVLTGTNKKSAIRAWWSLINQVLIAYRKDLSKSYETIMSN